MRVFHSLQLAHSSLFRATDRLLRALESVSSVQHAALMALSVKDGAPIGEIADMLGVGKSNLTGLIDRMEDRGLVRREAFASDARVTLVFIEPEGRAVLRRTRFLLKRLNERFLEPFSDAEQRTIERFLTFVASHAAEIVGGDDSAATVRNGSGR